jgi:hypothetical protein
VLECKSTVPVAGDHVARIGWAQFHRYLALPLTRSITYYVLPRPPWLGSPGQPPPLVPPEAAKWRGCEDWLYVVSARDLRRHYKGVPTGLELPSSDLPSISGSRTLKQFVANLRSCSVGRRVGPRPDGSIGFGPEPGPPDPELDASLEMWASDAGKPQMTPIVGFIPESDLNGS